MPRNKKIDTISQAAASQARQQNIKEGLSEIYQDDNGEIINVKKLEIKRERPWLWWLVLYGLAVLAAAGGVWYFLQRGTDATAVELNITAPPNLVAGQEFAYRITYRNLENVALKQLELHLDYPANFIFSGAEPAAAEQNNLWRLGELAAKGEGVVLIRGRLVNEVGKSNVILAELTYEPANFSSQFKKTAINDALIESSGLELTAFNNATALAGAEQKIVFKYKLKPGGTLSNFRLTVEPSELSDLEFIKAGEPNPNATLLKPWVWQVVGVSEQEQEIVIKYKFIDNSKDKYQFLLKLEYQAPPTASTIATVATSTATSTTDILPSADKYLLFYQETVEVSLIKNSLNLILVINGSDKDQGIDYGQTLNYSLTYANHNEEPQNEVIIMAVLEGNLLDWSTLVDKNKGQRKNNTIIWTKKEIPELASLTKGLGGTIDFSLKVKSAKDWKNKTANLVRSYAQFETAASQTSAAEIKASLDRRERELLSGSKTSSSDSAAGAAVNRSNVIVNKLNSDLSLESRLLYFNEDNIPLGSGPLPFTVGQKTVLRVFWQINNSLHDLADLTASVKLPDNVDWEGKERTSIGNISFDEANRTLVWSIGTLSNAVSAAVSANASQANAEFNIGVTPRAEQRHQILIIIPQATISSRDNATGETLTKTSVAKTSQLEDDPIISSSDIDINGGLVK